MDKTYHTYSIEALKKNIEQCDVNIKTYEGIIMNEQINKADLMKLVAEAQERDALSGEVHGST